MKTNAFEKLEEEVRASKLAAKFTNAPVVTILAGPAIIVEAILYKASKNSGIPMDWGFIGGRAYVYALGDTNKAAEAIRDVWPSRLCGTEGAT